MNFKKYYLSNLWGWTFLPCSPWVGRGTATPSTFHLGQHRATAPLWRPSCQHGALGTGESRGQRWGHRGYRAGDETGNSRIEPLLGAFLQDKRGNFSLQRSQTVSIFLYVLLQYIELIYFIIFLFLCSLGMSLRILAHEMLILKSELNILDVHWFPVSVTRAYKVSLKSVATEGRLDFRPLPMGGSLTVPRSYSRGLPSQVYATWEGPWQVEPVHCLWQGVFPPIVAIPNLQMFVQLYWKQECLLGGPIWETPTWQVFRKCHEGDFEAIGYRFGEMQQAYNSIPSLLTANAFE